MADLTKRAKERVRRWIEGPAVPSEEPRVLDALAALELVETHAGARLVAGEGAVAEALGLALAGERVAARATHATLAESLPVLEDAVRLRAPLVVHALPPLAEEGDSFPTAGVAKTGAVILAPRDLQEAVDLAVVARSLAEERLLPVVVRWDAGLAAAIQTVTLPPADRLREVLRTADELVHPRTPDQELLFGRHRRRVPRWHDIETPRRLTAGQAGRAAAISRRLFVDEGLEDALREAMDRWSRQTGRPLVAVHRDGAKNAALTLVATGSVAALARAVATSLPPGERKRIAVLGVQALCPVPRSELATSLRGDHHVLVLDEIAPSGPGFLADRVREALGGARDNGRLGHRARPELPSLADRDVPRVTALPVAADLRAADFAAVCRAALDDPLAGLLWPGFRSPSEVLPKRQARLDRLGRGVPGLGARLRALDASEAEIAPRGAVTIALAREGADPGAEPTRRLATLLHGLLGGHLRGRWGRPCRENRTVVDRLTWAPEPFDDPAEGVAADLLVWLPRSAESSPPGSLVRSIRPGGAVVLPAIGEGLPSSFVDLLDRRGLELWTLGAERDLGADRALGAVCALLARRGHDAINLRRLLGAAKSLEVHDPAAVEAFQAELSKGFEGSRLVATSSLRAIPEVQDPDAWLPGTSAPAPGAGVLDDLPDLWDQVGMLRRRGEADAVAPDPRLATGATPPASARLASLLERVAPPPSFQPSVCTACGDCWIGCPHGSIEARVLTPAELLGEGIRQAGQAGRSADALRPVVGKLATRLAPALGEGGTLGPALDAAFADLLATSPPPEARREAISEAFRAVRDSLADLPATVSQAPFHAPESEARGRGELLLLGIDPDTCTGCRMCVEACAPDALVAELTLTPGRDGALRGVARGLSMLPAPSAESRERLDAALGAPRGEMLSASARTVLQGSDGAEAGSGARLALRLTLGTAAGRRLAAREPLLREIDELREGLARSIHDTLGQALPDRDLDALARGLESLERPETELAELTARVETAFDGDRVDVARLRRLVETARTLADLRAGLAPGGAAAEAIPLSLVVTGEPAASWAGGFPWNPFGVATTVVRHGAGPLARGLADAHRDAALDRARLLRRARHEIETPATTHRPPSGLADLRWEDLTPTERSLCPRLVLVTDDAMFRRELGPMLELLRADRDATLLILDETGDEDDASFDPGLLDALANGRASGQTSVAFPGHLERAVATVLVDEGPGLLRVHAPSPSRGRFAPAETLAVARRAVETGRVPLFLSSRDRTCELTEVPDPDSLPENSRELWATLRTLAGTAPPETRPGVISADELAALEHRHAEEMAGLEARLQGDRIAADRETRRVQARRLRSRLLAAMERPAAPRPDPEAPPS